MQNEEVKQLSGEERIDALCKALEEKHGFKLPEDVYQPKKEARYKHSGDDTDAGDWTQAGDGTDYPKADTSENEPSEPVEE